MIITVTGKPCSGKDTIGKVFAQKYNFELMQMGEIFRQYSKKFGVESITKFINDERVKKVDEEVDMFIYNVGKTQLESDIIIISRTAWHFIPKSFKVFLDVGIDVAASRLLEDKRDSEPVKDLADAKLDLEKRWQSENVRYQKLYGINNTNLKNYDLIISTDNKTVDEVVLEIHKNYLKFLKKANKNK